MRDPLKDCPKLQELLQSADEADRQQVLSARFKMSDADWQALERIISAHLPSPDLPLPIPISTAKKKKNRQCKQ